MSLINNIKLGNKLVLIMAVPFLAMIAFSIVLFQQASTNARNAETLESLTNIAIAVNAAIDGLQPEQDFSLQFIKSRGRKLVAELNGARAVTTQSEQTLKRMLDESGSGSLTQQEVAILNRVRTEIERLGEVRQAVDDLQIKRDQVEAYYENLMAELMELVDLMQQVSLDKKVADTVAAYGYFLRLKKHAARERSILNQVFGFDQFIGSNFSDLTRSIHYQETYEAGFLNLASAAEQEQYRLVLQHSSVQETAQMRDKAIMASDYGAFGIEPAEWDAVQGQKLELLNQVAGLLTDNLRLQVDARYANSQQIRWAVSAIAVAAVLLSILFWWSISQGIRHSLTSVSRVLGRIAVGDLTSEINQVSKDEFGQVLSAFDKMQSDLKRKLDREAKVAAENARIKVALDSMSANLMLADQDNNIVYLNPAAYSLFSSIEQDLDQDIPGFKADEIVGSNIDRFHKNPVHQQRLVAGLSGQHEAQFVTGGRTMAFAANPVLDDQGQRIGTVVEWQDKTDELNAEIEIQSIVDAVQQGDLERRIVTDGKSGFFLNLSEGINRMVEEIANTLNDINDVMSAMAHGDLTRNIDNNYLGTFASVAQNVNTTIEQLSNMVGEIRLASEDVSTTSVEILDGNNSLSARTEHQAAALEQTASSVEQITSTVKQNSNNAQQANSLSAEARDMADKGGQVVDDAVRAMQEINESSERIAEIISVIDEIAFQTNLLALNASVEATRAGEQGRGFAVVATEVRNLAQRSATAAKEIKELIQDSVLKVNVGSDLVNKSGETLKEIVQGVKKVGDIVGEIAAASKEQTAGI